MKRHDDEILDSALQQESVDAAERGTEPAELEPVWGALGEIEPEVPSERLRHRLHATIAAAERAPGPPMTTAAARRSALELRPSTAWLAAAALLLVGVALGRGWGLVGSGNAELKALRAEMQSVSRVVAISLLQHPSAGERIRAAQLSVTAENGDEVVTALLEALEDVNVNVRLAAVDALRPRVEAEGLGQGLIQRLAAQTSPLVQYEISGLLIERGRPDELRQAAAIDGLAPEVQERLEAVAREIAGDQV